MNPMDNKPFYTKNLLEEREMRDIIGVSLNAKERAQLEEMKETLDMPGDSNTLKVLAEIGVNVIRNQISKDLMQRLVSKSRVRGEGRVASQSIYHRKSFTKVDGDKPIS